MSRPDSDEEGDEHRADGISDHQVVLLHQQSGDDDSNTAQSVGYDMQENSCQPITLQSEMYTNSISQSQANHIYIDMQEH